MSIFETRRKRAADKKHDDAEAYAEKIRKITAEEIDDNLARAREEQNAGRGHLRSSKSTRGPRRA